MKTKYEHFHLVEIEYPPNETKRKTHVFEIRNNRSDALLGWILWENGWRQYVATYTQGSIFSTGCMSDLQDFIRQLMEARKVAAASAQGTQTSIS